ncbi:MAG: DUF3343 domain-containing protein [Clostridia bacterium]|nr:DUF3343 domain-containing protein [Clostridia bacterium]
MKQERILVSSITYAIKGRDLLRSLGYKAYIERTKGQLEHGCGYSIYVTHDTEGAKRILEQHHIRMLQPGGGYE